jgi:hypothetical protein
MWAALGVIGLLAIAWIVWSCVRVHYETREAISGLEMKKNQRAAYSLMRVYVAGIPNLKEPIRRNVFRMAAVHVSMTSDEKWLELLQMKGSIALSFQEFLNSLNRAADPDDPLTREMHKMHLEHRMQTGESGDRIVR